MSQLAYNWYFRFCAIVRRRVLCVQGLVPYQPPERAQSEFRFPVELNHLTPQRVLNEIDGQYVCEQVHARGRVRQSIVQCTMDGGEIGWEGIFFRRNEGVSSRSESS